MKAEVRSHGLWQASAPPTPVCERLPGSAKADVAVIGAGFTGLSAALPLAQGWNRLPEGHVVQRQGSDLPLTCFYACFCTRPAATVWFVLGSIKMKEPVLE